MAKETKQVFKAVHRFARISPRKARLVMDLIRGKPVEEALVALRLCQRRASPMVNKVVRSAVASATQEAGLSSEELVVWRAFVDDGPRVKRFRPRAQGRAYPRIRRSCHLSVVLRKAPEPGPGEAKKREAVAGGSKG